jgi:hypothetical protein
MRWQKRGVLVSAPAPVSWASSHAMVPFVERLGSAHRLYFSARDEHGRSATGIADLDPAVPRVTRFHDRPVLGPGPLGAFDDSGAMGSCLIDHEGRKYLYYIGWSRGVSVPFYTFIGCATSEDGGHTFTRVSDAPVVERGPHDPFFTTSPWVLVENGLWRMWYASGTGWQPREGGPQHRYHIRYAESDDGITWRRAGRVCVDHEGDDEYAIARPCVVRDGERYRMWYSYRGDAYRIGYAVSADGLEWERKDADAGIDVSPEGWDSEMIEYPCVFEHESDWFLLYNGNGYGATGIGLAVLQSDD